MENTTESHIFTKMPCLRKNNTWRASYQDENGQTRRKTFKTKEEAINWEREKRVYQRRRREKKERELANLSERKESVKNSNAVESKGITLFQELAQEASQSPFLQKLTSDKLFKKNVEGTLADVYIHEDTKEDDRKVRCLQFKVTEKKSIRDNIYKFNHVNRGKYKNCLIICVALDSQKIWWIEYDSKHLPDTKHGTLDMCRKRVQAIEKDGGLLDFKDQISIKRFEDAYNNLPMISEIEAREPTSPTQKKEHLGIQQYIDLDPRQIRWEVPHIENGVVDMFISFDNTDDFKKVQFKSLSFERTKHKNGRISSLRCKCFSKHIAGTRNKGKQCYNFGDNDLYVFLCFRWEGEEKRKKDGDTLKMTELCGYFEIPEEALLARDLVVEKGKVGRECFNLYPPAEHRALYGINANPLSRKKDLDKEDPTKHWAEKFYQHLDSETVISISTK